jgi:hypothetical protein
MKRGGEGSKKTRRLAGHREVVMVGGECEASNS